MYIYLGERDVVIWEWGAGGLLCSGTRSDRFVPRDTRRDMTRHDAIHANAAVQPSFAASVNSSSSGSSSSRRRPEQARLHQDALRHGSHTVLLTLHA